MLAILAGAGVGGLSGAIGRVIVALLFLKMISDGEGSFFGGGSSGVSGVGADFLWFLLLSALIGLIGCGAAGATCRVVIAVPLGAILSGLPCFVLVAFPSTLMMSMSGGNNEPDLHAVWVGFLGMVIVGALAGAFGAQIGKLVARQS